MAEPTRRVKRPGGVQKQAVPVKLLDEGDTVELAVTLSQNYNTVRVAASSTVRPGESPQGAYDRLYEVCLTEANEVIKEIK